jgi:hypothetical protein
LLAGSKSNIGDRCRRAAEDRARERPIENAVIKVLKGVELLPRVVMPKWNHIVETSDAEATEMLLCVLELTHEQLQRLHTKLCGHSDMIKLNAHLSAATSVAKASQSVTVWSNTSIELLEFENSDGLQLHGINISSSTLV